MLSLKILVGKKKKKTATRSESGDEYVVRKAEAEGVNVEVDEEKVTVVKEVVETKRVKEV